MPLTATSLKYKGAFKVPTAGSNNLNLAYANGALAYNPANNSLFIVGHDHTQCIAEISIPAPVIGSIGAINRATFIQSPRTVPIPTDLAGTVKIGGLYVDNGNLYGTRYIFYDADLSATRSHFKLNGTNLNQTAQGLFAVEAPNPAWVAGYMGAIPVEQRSKFGGKKHFTGFGSLSIISRTSSGPAAFAINLEEIGATVADTIPMVGYPLSNPLNNPDVKNEFYTRADTIKGAVFYSDTLMVFGVHGNGNPCYGEGSTCGDPLDGSKGEHSYPYRVQVWVYSVDDLAAVAAGTKQMHQLMPNIWVLTNFYSMQRFAGGVAFDQTTNRIFVCERYGEETQYDPFPVIHVYEIEGQTEPPPPDVTPPTFTVTPMNITATTADLRVNNISELGEVSGDVNGAPLPTVQISILGDSTTYNLGGLSPETLYTYSITVRDLANNTATLNGSFNTLAAPPPDVTAPTVSNLQAVNITDRSATVTWNTNEPSITYIDVNGLLLGDNVLKTSHSVPLNNLTSNTQYTCVITTRDSLGNSDNQAGAVVFTTLVSNPEPSGLLSQWSFSETTGTYTYDQLNRRGTISGAVRVAGKSGNGLSFDGVNDRVNIADGNYLDFTNNFTVAAWVYPRKNTGWRTVVLKERSGGLCYALYASDDTGKPNAYINIGGGDVGVVGPNSLPLNQWSHLAFTYSSGSFKLYVNGALVRTLNVSGNVTTSTGAFRFGGNAVWSEWLDGIIDEVRLYNRALSASEIASLLTL